MSLSRYTQADEESIRTQTLVLEWTRSGMLDKSQSARIEADLLVDLRQTNQFLRAVLFVFTCLIVAASVALIVTTLHLDDKAPFAVACFVSSLTCYGLAEYVISRFRVYRFGAEEALAVCATLLMTISFIVITDTIAQSRTLELPIIVGLSIGACGGFGIYRRFGYLYAALASILCATALPFQFHLPASMERVLAASILLAVFLIVRSRRLFYGDDFPGDDYGLIQAAAAAGVYLVCNLQLTLEFSGPQTSGAFYWLTYILIWIVPVVALRLALGARDRPLLDVSLGMAIATLVTNKPYLGLSRQPWDPILFGVFLVAAAIAVRRWLLKPPAGQRHGFTPSRILAGDRRVLALIGTFSVLQPDFPDGPSTPAGPKFGGGRSGGAGASGSF